MIVGLVPTHREGPLAADAVRSLLACCNTVMLTEGPIGGTPSDVGEPTDIGVLRRDSRVLVTARGKWTTEADKRNGMLERTRRYPPPVWGVYVDADEVLLHGELIPSLIWAAEQQQAGTGNDVTAIPLAVTEIDGSVGRAHRLIRLDRLERHVLSCSQLQFAGQSIVTTFPVVPVWRPGEPLTATNRPPMAGEPHVHHRQYLRPPTRSEHRLHAAEIGDFAEQHRTALERIGMRPNSAAATPLQNDPTDLDLIVASDASDIVPPDDPYGILRK